MKRLELKQKEDNIIDVYSGVRLAGTIIYQQIPYEDLNKFGYFFKPNHDCGCVWTDLSLIELGNKIKNMNDEIIEGSNSQ